MYLTNTSEFLNFMIQEKNYNWLDNRKKIFKMLK